MGRPNVVVEGPAQVVNQDLAHGLMLGIPHQSPRAAVIEQEQTCPTHRDIGRPDVVRVSLMVEDIEGDTNRPRITDPIQTADGDPPD